jgi:hypothetical protein
MYRAFGLLQPSSNFTLDEAAARLTARLPDRTVTVTGGQITVSSPGWEIELAVTSGPEVAADSAVIAEKLGGPDAAGWASDRRVEVWSETPDYEMAHFNDYLTVVEVLKSFTGVVAVDPSEPSLL